MEKNEHTAMAAVGDAASIMAFRALGVKTYPAEDAQEIEQTVIRLARDGVKIILITEPAAKKVQELISAYRDRTFPILLVVPDRNGTDGYGMEKIQSNMERAIGSSLGLGADREDRHAEE